jgi:hypothetical protein
LDTEVQVLLVLYVELKIVPNRIVVEDKYVHYPIHEPKTEHDKLCNSTAKAVRVSKRLNKPLITRKNDFVW